MAALLSSLLPIPALRAGSFLLSCRSGVQASKMSSWTIEKQIFLNMPVEEKRKSYRVKKYTEVDSLPKWKDMIGYNGKPLQRDIEIFGNTQIDQSLNSRIADSITIWSGDITTLEIDAIVNAANSKLQGGGGVDGAIHRGAGPLLLEECSTLGGCPTGFAKITGGYLLPAKYVIHTVGPTNKSAESLTKCYMSCFALQVPNEIKTIAFPCIATGIYGFPNVDAAHIACRETRMYLEKNFKDDSTPEKVEKVIFCVFEKKDLEIYESVAQLYFPKD